MVAGRAATINTRLLCLSLPVRRCSLIEWHQPLLGAAVVPPLLSPDVRGRAAESTGLAFGLILMFSICAWSPISLSFSRDAARWLTSPRALPGWRGGVATDQQCALPFAAHYSPDWLLIAYAVTAAVVSWWGHWESHRPPLSTGSAVMACHGYSVPFMLPAGADPMPGSSEGSHCVVSEDARA